MLVYYCWLILIQIITFFILSALRYLSLGAGQENQMKEEGKSTSATAVYEVARPILQGCHAIPTKLKILLDRALSALAQEEVLMIVSGCGWQLDDYQRGYKLKVISIVHIRFLRSRSSFFHPNEENGNSPHILVKQSSLLIIRLI